MGMNKLPEVVLIDEEDRDRVMRHSWSVNKLGYVSSSKGSLHRFIMQCEKGDAKIVDHINHNPLDNRKKNLRLVTASQSNINRRAQKNGSSGHKGIYWEKDRERWRAYATKDGKKYHIGVYKTLEEAVRGYSEKIGDIHGEWAVKSCELF